MNAIEKEKPLGDVAVVSIENPLSIGKAHLVRHVHGVTSYRPDRVQAERSLRDDPLARLRVRSQILECDYRAGREWQRLYEDSQIGRLGSSGDLKEPVDGSPHYREPITDRQQKASKRIAELDLILGAVGKQLVRDILGERLWMREVSVRHGRVPEKPMLDFLGRRFKECLSTLAREFGYA